MAVGYKGGKCVECGETHLACLQFHHLDPEIKEIEWSKLKQRSWDIQKAELDKCVCLCGNCHAKIHYKL